MDKGGDTSSAETLLDYTNAICSIPDLGNIRNGYETFSGNTVLEEIPECLADASQYFTSMYKFCKDCTALKRVPRLYTEHVTTFVYAFYGCTALQEIDGGVVGVVVLRTEPEIEFIEEAFCSTSSSGISFIPYSLDTNSKTRFWQTR